MMIGVSKIRIKIHTYYIKSSIRTIEWHLVFGPKICVRFKIQPKNYPVLLTVLG